MKAQTAAITLALYVALAYAGELATHTEDGYWVAELDEKTVVVGDDTSGKRVSLGRGRELRCEDTFKLVTTSDRKFASCCETNQSLFKGEDNVFRCCAEGHKPSGSPEVGYHCCLNAHVWDGTRCKAPDPVCTNGKVLVDGKCACPTGQVEAADGKCKPKAKCDSGLQSGKCYTFTAENGERYGYDDRVGYGYVPRAHDVHHRFGKFQLCSDQACTAGLPIDPDTSFRIRDIHGSFDVENAMQWLDNSSNGGHIGKTPSWERAGVFSLTRWPCGKYCWGGFEQGLGPTCPAEAVGVTLYTQDKNICVPITITEVPCDIKSLDNNCIWRNGADQCCSPMDCTNRDAKKDA